MTVTIAKVSGTQEHYYDSKQEKYYTEEHVAQNKYGGEGAQELDIYGSLITQGDKRFSHLFQGQHPHTGDPLVQNRTRIYQDESGSKVYKRVAAYDICFSPPKSVSVLEALCRANGEHEKAQKFWHAQEKAINTTLRHVEKRLLFTRTGAGGKNHERVNGTFALMHHSTSRVVSHARYPDPQLHTHCLLFNVGMRRDGHTGAIDARPLFRSHHTLGDIYHRTLQQELKREFGFTFDYKPLKKGWSFEISGISPDLLRAFSKRRIQIEENLQGKETSKQVKTAVLATRNAKSPSLDRKTLYAHWNHTATTHGFDVHRFLRTVEGRQKQEVTSQTSPEAHRKTEKTVLPKGPQPQRSHSHLPRFSLQHFHTRFKLKPRSHSRSASQKHRRRMKRKFLWLYATGRISRKTYLRVTQGKGLPRTKFGIDVAYATYKVSQTQRFYLYHKYGHGLPKGTPTTKVGINLAYATKQISAGQRLYLLSQKQKAKLSPERKQFVTRHLRRTLSTRKITVARQATKRPSFLRQTATVRSHRHHSQPVRKITLKR